MRASNLAFRNNNCKYLIGGSPQHLCLVAIHYTARQMPRTRLTSPTCCAVGNPDVIWDRTQRDPYDVIFMKNGARRIASPHGLLYTVLPTGAALIFLV